MEKYTGRSHAEVAGAFREMKQNNIKQWKSWKTGRGEVGRFSDYFSTHIKNVHFTLFHDSSQ